MINRPDNIYGLRVNNVLLEPKRKGLDEFEYKLDICLAANMEHFQIYRVLLCYFDQIFSFLFIETYFVTTTEIAVLPPAVVKYVYLVYYINLTIILLRLVSVEDSKYLKLISRIDIFLYLYRLVYVLSILKLEK